MDIIIFCLEKTNPNMINISNYPLSLIGIGNTPYICIMLEEIIQSISFKSITTIYIACEKSIVRSFQNELERMYPYYDNIKVIEISPDFEMMDTKMLQNVFETYSIKRHCVIIKHKYYPLISSTSFSLFFRKCQDSIYGVMCSELFKYNEDDNFSDIYVVGTIENSVRLIGLFMDVNCIILKDNIYLCMDVFFIDTREFLKQKPQDSLLSIFNNKGFNEVVVISNLNKIESTRMVTYADKIYIENYYIEKKNIEFLNRAFIIWKQCLELDEKILYLEQKLDSINKFLYNK